MNLYRKELEELFWKQSFSYNKQYVQWMFSCALTLQCFTSDSSVWGGSPHEFLTRITCFGQHHCSELWNKDNIDENQ